MTDLVPRRIADRTIETAIDGETVIMDLASGDFYSLEDSGAAIWALIDGTRSCAAITAALAETFDAPDAAIAADVDAFVAMLEAKGIVAR